MRKFNNKPKLVSFCIFCPLLKILKHDKVKPQLNFQQTQCLQNYVCVTEVSYWITYFLIVIHTKMEINFYNNGFLITLLNNNHPKILYFSSLFQLTFFQNFTNFFLPFSIHAPNEFPECPLLSLNEKTLRHLHENNKNWIMTEDFFFSGTWKLCFERKDVDSIESKLAQFMDDNKEKFSP